MKHSNEHSFIQTLVFDHKRDKILEADHFDLNYEVLLISLSFCSINKFPLHSFADIQFIYLLAYLFI